MLPALLSNCFTERSSPLTGLPTTTVRGHILRHRTACADDGSFPDGHAFQDKRACAYEHVVFDCARRGGPGLDGLGVVLRGGRGNARVHDRDIAAHQHAVANGVAGSEDRRVYSSRRRSTGRSRCRPALFMTRSAISMRSS